LRGAEEKLEVGIITPDQFDEIKQVVNSVELFEFRPVLYLIPYHNVAGAVREATVAERAHPLSLELIIESLGRQYFDPIEVL
jgi:hypothetical protein